MAGNLTLRHVDVRREECNGWLNGATVCLDYGPSPAPQLDVVIRLSVPEDLRGRTVQLREAVLTAALDALAEVEWPWTEGGARP